MLDDVFDRAHVCRRLRANALGVILDDFSKHMQQRGLARGTMQQYLGALEHFGRWLHKQRRLPKVITNESISAFLTGHLPKCRCQAHCPSRFLNVRAALHQLIRMLRERGQLPVRKYKPTAMDIVVDGFRVHLAENCGLAERTIEKRAYYVGSFLKETFAAGRFLPARIRRHHLHAYVANFAKTRQPESANAVAICLRSFLRYLHFRGQVSASLVAAVPTIRKWKLDRLPRTMDDEQLNSFLRQFDRSSAAGRLVITPWLYASRNSDYAPARWPQCAWTISIGNERCAQYTRWKVSSRACVAFDSSSRKGIGHIHPVWSSQDLGGKLYSYGTAHRAELFSTPNRFAAQCGESIPVYRGASVGRALMCFVTLRPRDCTVEVSVSRTWRTFSGIVRSIPRPSTPRSI